DHAGQLRPGLGGLRRHLFRDVLPKLADLLRGRHDPGGVLERGERLRLRSAALRRAALLVRDDAAHADAADPGPGDPRIHRVQQAGSAEYILAATAPTRRWPGVL